VILISAEEKKVVREHCPDTYIVRTMIHRSDRHRYYMTEDPDAMEVVNIIRCNGSMLEPVGAAE